MMRRKEGVIPRDMVGRVLDVAGDDTVLVGGQALAFWMIRYGVFLPGDLDVVTHDMDFAVIDRAIEAPLKRFAKAMGGTYEISHAAMSQLVGIASVPLDATVAANVDVLWKVRGFEPGELERRAVQVTDADGRRYRVMHPLDVLRSRCINLHEIPEKRDDKGQAQARLACEIVRRFLVDQIRTAAATATAEERDRIALKAFRPIRTLATTQAARKNAARYGIHAADAIPAALVGPDSAFWERDWGILRSLMSAAYAQHCEDQRDECRDTQRPK